MWQKFLTRNVPYPHFSGVGVLYATLRLSVFVTRLRCVPKT